MIRLAAIAVPFALIAAPAVAKICVRNGADAPLFFVAETAEDRRHGWLAPGETLCAAGSGGERVAVFQAEDALEGCTRLLPGGGGDTLLRYAAFDNCLWRSHLD